MEHPYLNPIPANPTARHGEAGRKARQVGKELAAMRLVDHLLRSTLPQLLQQPPVRVGESVIESFADTLFEGLAKKGLPYYAMTAGWNRFCDFLDAGNRDGQWSYPAVPRLHQLPVQKLLRTLKWQRDSSLLHEIDRKLIRAIEQADSSVLESAPVLIGLALYYAATQSGIGTSQNLTALVTGIIADEAICHDQATGSLWMRLIIRDTAVTNACLDGEWVRLERLFLDPITVSLIRRFRASDRRLPSETFDGNKLIGWVNDAIAALGTNCPRLTSLKQLGRVALSIEEQYTDIPQALYEAAMGNVGNVVVPEWHWRAVNVLIPPTLNDYGRPTTQGEGNQSTPPAACHPVKRNMSIEAVCTQLRDSIYIPPKTKATAKLRRKAIKSLQAIDSGDWPITGKMLRAWYLHHLVDRKNELGTVNTYHAAIGPALLDAMRELDAYDAENLDEAYRRVIDGRNSEKAMIYAARRLTDLHAFSQGVFGLPSLYEPLVSGTTEHRHVRAAFISEDVYRQGFNAISSLEYRDVHYKQRLSVLWIIAYRTGLRRNDLLRLQLRDVEKGKNLMLKVRNNRLGTGKTDNARRVIPLGVLLIADEYELVNAFIDKQRRKHSSDLSAALFDVEGAPKEKIDPKHVSNDVVTILDSIGHPGVLHDFRHTALSRLFLIGEREWDLVERYSAYSEEKAEAIYTAVFGSLYVRHERYRALAAFAGHASPSVTFDYYIHFAGLVLQARLRRSTRGYSDRFLSQITGIGKTRIRNAARAHHMTTDDIAPEAIRPLVIRESRSVLVVVPPRSAPETPPLRIKRVADSSVTLWTAFAALTDWQKGHSSATIAYDHGIPEPTLKRYVTNGQRLAEEKTRWDTSRLIATSRKAGQRPLLVPSVPTSPILTADARSIVCAFRDMYKAGNQEDAAVARGDIEWAVVYWLTHSMTTEAFAVFRKPDDLQRFLKVCNGAIHDSRWRIEIPLHEDSNVEVTRKAWRLRKDTIIARISPKGRTESNFVRVRLKHPNDKDIVARMQRSFDTSETETRQLIVKRYSAHTLHFVFHMMAITMFSTDRLTAALDAVRLPYAARSAKAVGDR